MTDVVVVLSRSIAIVYLVPCGVPGTCYVPGVYPWLLRCPVVACGFVVFWSLQAPKARPGEGGAGSTIDFSTLFQELDSDSDFTSDESDDSTGGDDDNDGNDVARVQEGGTVETTKMPPG